MLFENHISWKLPKPETYPQAVFGAKRKYDIHTGIDIYVPYGTRVYPIKNGTIINIEWFTGTKSSPQTPWWNDTKAIWIQSENESEVFIYGELDIDETIEIGTKVSTSDCIGTVAEVLKVNKGKNPTTMLHIELYSSIPTETVIWNHNETKPELLLDPTDIIKGLKND
jgi:murein DD-endopeptidase MepM/ murein hydrolase activator NlpD